MKIFLGLAMAIFLAALSFPLKAEAFCTLRTANGRELVWDCNAGVILRYEKTHYFRAAISKTEGFRRHTQYPGATLWQYYADGNCQTAPMIVSFTKSPNWDDFFEGAQFVDENYFYVASQDAIPTAASAILSSNSLLDPAVCYSTVGWWDEGTTFVFTPVVLKPLAHFGTLTPPFTPVIPKP